MAEEARRARCAWALSDAAGARTKQGDAEAVIDDAGLSVGTVRVDFLDADALRAADYSVELDLWPAGRLVLSMLGRRFDTFTHELRQARNQARVAGLLAHAPTMPEVFNAAVRLPGSEQAVELQVYPTHVTIVPSDSDPWQIPLGALDDLVVMDDPPAVALVTGKERIVIGQLGRRRDEFHATAATHRNAQAQILGKYTDRSGFSDGVGVPRDKIAGFNSLLERCSSAARLEGARRLLASAGGGEPRLGFVELLDPDVEGLQAAAPLPENWASFLLVPVGKRVVLEILAGPSAATYIFDGDMDAVNVELRQLHFRRAALALNGAQAELTPDNPHRLALRRLAPLRRLRAATRARLVHVAGWAAALSEALTGG